MPSLRRVHCKLDNAEIGLEHVHLIGEELCKGFVIDQYNRDIITRMMWYFMGDERFKTHESQLGNLNMGILLIGEPGTGKTLLMNIFQEFVKIDDLFFFVENNKRATMVYPIVPCVDIVSEFESSGHGTIQNYSRRRIICFDDLGEEKKDAVYYGSHENVMQILLESRYNKTGISLATTNHKVDDLGEMYGARVKSRIYDMFNIMVLRGPDRRVENIKKQFS